MAPRVTTFAPGSLGQVDVGAFLPAAAWTWPPAATGTPALPPVLVPAWWHVVLSQLTCCWDTELPSSLSLTEVTDLKVCTIYQRWRIAEGEDGECCSAWAGRSWRWTEGVVETEKKNGILQQGRNGVVHVPHYSSQWPTNLFWPTLKLCRGTKATCTLTLVIFRVCCCSLKCELDVLMFCLKTQAFRFVILPS